MSTEARLLLGPAAAFRELVQEQPSGGWVLVRRPLLLALMFGFTVSLQASGRLSVQLVADGTVSFAFVPVFEMAALAAVYWVGQRPIPFARAVDLFFAANAPWLLWLIAFAALRCVQTPRQAAAPPLAVVWVLEASLVLIAAWSAYIDFHFFREVLQRRSGSAVVALILQRGIGWSLAIAYFLGYAIWPHIVAWVGG